MRDSVFFRLLKRHLSEQDLDALCSALELGAPEDYDSAIDAAVRVVLGLSPVVMRNQERAETHCQPETPIRRLQMLADNSPPPMLMAITRAAFRESYAERFDNRPRSLELAKVGLQAARLLRESGYLGTESQTDLEGEAWTYLANAERINSNIRGAEAAFGKAESLLSSGTGDRELKAKLLSLRANLRFSQARSDEAAELYDQEIKLRRLLGDPEALGQALINRGIVASWTETATTACELLSEGAELVSDEDYLLLALNPIAERLARDGEGLLALKAIHRAETLGMMAGSGSHRLRLRWITGIAYRALGHPREAEQELRAVREQLADEAPGFRTGILSLDLAAVCAAQGKTAEVRELAEEAYAIFRSEGLGQRALAALIVFQKAALAEELTEALAVRVANFIAAYQYNRSLLFEPESEE